MKVKRKVILSEEDIKQIITLYQTKISSTHKLAKKFKIGHKKISEILKNNNVEINKKGGQYIEVEKQTTKIVEGAKVIQYKSDNPNKEYLAICKKTGKQFNDVNNYSGALTDHIKKTFGDVPVPSNTYQRKKYEIKHGKKWYEEYFNILEVDKKLVSRCGLCNWETKDIDNKTGAFTKHIIDEHNIKIAEYIEKFPEQSLLWGSAITIIDKKNNITQSVLCLECNERFLGLTETHMKTRHNMSILEYKKKWGEVAIFSDKTSEFFSIQTSELNKTMEPKFTSKAQSEIYEYIKNLGFDVLLNNRTELDGTEMDIFIPLKKIGIEYNGLYWHSENSGKKNKLYHLNKTELAKKHGIRLIQIFEDEWNNKKEIVLMRLENILGVNKRKLYARNCQIKEIDAKLKDDFLNKTHIQGKDNSSIRLGGFINNELVGVMTFSKPRKSIGFSKNNLEKTYEMIRFASLGVTGLASKLLKYFIDNYKPNKITTYADRRWTPIHENCMYEKLKFSYLGETKPNYWYTKKYTEREHRYNYRKDSLVKEGFDSRLTEFEIMKLKGFDKIWDCGSFKYELIPNY
jgi:predicted transcriptional regulator